MRVQHDDPPGSFDRCDGPARPPRLGVAPPSRAASIVATTGGFADTTPDFYRVDYQAGDPGASVRSVTFTLPAGSFDFDGDTSFMNATAPVLDLTTLYGLTAADIAFRFDGPHPQSLAVDFAPGAFGVGDSFAFGADADDLGSKLGGVFGAGASFAATLDSGLSGSVPFRTDTSVHSTATLVIGPEADVPAPTSWALLATGLTGLTLRRKRARCLNARDAIRAGRSYDEGSRRHGRHPSGPHPEGVPRPSLAPLGPIGPQTPTRCLGHPRHTRS